MVAGASGYHRISGKRERNASNHSGNWRTPPEREAPTREQREVAIASIRATSPTIISKYRDVANRASGYEWTFDEVREMCAEVGAEVRRLTSDMRGRKVSR